MPVKKAEKKIDYRIPVLIIFSILLFVGIFTVTDYNTRKSGFGGNIPEQSTLIGEIAAGIELKFPYIDLEGMYNRFKLILPAEDAFFLNGLQMMTEQFVDRFHAIE